MNYLLLGLFLFIVGINFALVVIWLVQEFAGVLNSRRNNSPWTWRCAHCAFFVRSTDIDVEKIISKHISRHQNG